MKVVENNILGDKKETAKAWLVGKTRKKSLKIGSVTIVRRTYLLVAYSCLYMAYDACAQV